jgi:hypothetical protein
VLRKEKITVLLKKHPDLPWRHGEKDKFKINSFKKI